MQVIQDAVKRRLAVLPLGRDHREPSEVLDEVGANLELVEILLELLLRETEAAARGGRGGGLELCLDRLGDRKSVV